MRCPPVGVVVRDPAVHLSGVRSPGVVVRGDTAVRPAAVHPSSVQPLLSTHPVSSRPVSTRLVSVPSVWTRPSRPVSGGGVGDQVGAAGTRHHGNGSRSRWVAASWSGSVDGPAGLGGDAAEVARRSVGVGGPGRVMGGGGRVDQVSDQAGKAGVRSAGRWRLRQDLGGAASQVAAPAAWLPSCAGGRPRWVVVAEADARAGGRAGEGRCACRRGWGCGPSAAQASSGRSRFAADSALTWGDSWWACQDLNLGPHPERRIPVMRRGVGG
jgi:hypothetical protein